jgi:type II secretion system protein G
MKKLNKKQSFLFFRQKTAGFTLIELLVVISIIGLLSSVILSSLNSARKKADTAKRLSEMRQLRSALDLYYSDYGAYPVSTGGWHSECRAFNTPNTSGANNDQVAQGLVPTYIASFPRDPGFNPSSKTDASIYSSCVIYYSDGIDYKVMYTYIKDFSYTDYNVHPTFVDPKRDDSTGWPTVDCNTIQITPWTWAIWSEGGKCF